MSRPDPLARLKELLGGMSRPGVPDTVPAAQPVQANPVAQPQAAADPRLAQIQQLQQQADTDPRPRVAPDAGVARKLLFRTIQGLRGAGDPQGFAGLKQREDVAERTRQQDLLGRVKMLQEGVNTDRGFKLDEGRESRIAQDADAQQKLQEQSNRRLEDTAVAQQFHQADTLAETTRHNKATEAAGPVGTSTEERELASIFFPMVANKYKTTPEALTPEQKAEARQLRVNQGDVGRNVPVNTVNAAGQPVTKFVQPQGEYAAAPTADMRNRQASIEKSRPVFATIKNLSEQINVNAGLAAKAIGVVEKAKAAGNLNDLVSVYESTISGFTPLIARSVGHTGVLTEQDVSSVKELFPKVGDSKSLRDAKIANVEWIMNNISAIQGQPLTQTLAPYVGQQQARPRATNANGDVMEFDGKAWVPAQ